MADERIEKQKVKEITDKLEEGLKELFESEKYKSYLSTMSKFHNYSFNNTLLIAMQKPEATLVAGYKAWQKNFERHVNKGEKAIRILAPAPYKIKEERDKIDPVTGEMTFDENGMPQKEEVEVTIPAFRAVSVFDVSQTDGKPIPELEALELLSTVEGYEDFVNALMFVSPVPIGFEDIPGDSKGYYHTEEKRIAIQENMSESQTLKTMVHEVAHSMLHNKEVNQDILAPAKDRNTKEVEAESVAYTVCHHFGIDTSDYSFGYIAGWSSGKDMKELKSSLDTIRHMASELITGIETQLQELQLNREMEQSQSKESLLLIQNDALTEFSLINVRGMDRQELIEVLSAMNEDDKLSIPAYLESKGAWTTEFGNEQSEEVEEYHFDVRYNTDTGEIKDMKAEMEQDKRAKEPIGAAQLLYGNTDKYGIYQLKDNPELRQFRFEGTESLKRMGITKDNFDAVKMENYNLIYVGELSELQGPTQGETLEAVYEKFNIDHPTDYKGHSLSVSDIVVLHQDGENTAHFVDSFGFTTLPEFLKEQTQALEVAPEDVWDTSGQDVNQSVQQNGLKPELEKMQDMENGDEIIDLGDEKEQVLVEMKQSLKGELETELAFQIADRFISIQEVDGGYDYSIMGVEYKEIDGGVYDNPEVSIREALHDIVDDLKSEPDHNGAKGNISKDDELIPIDYDGLMEKVEEANRIRQENTQSSVVADFKAKTGELFHDISEMNPEEIEETVKCHVQAKIEEYDIDATIVDVAVTGSRCRGLEHEGSDLDVVVELSTAEREDDLFNAFNEDGLHIGDVKVDINPITAQRTGTLESYLPQVEEYLEGVRQVREQEKESAEVTLTVSECGEFHNLGECYENIPTVDEAIAIWKQIPSERMNGIPAIGINILGRGAEPFENYEIDVLSGKRIDLGVLDYVPDIKNNPQAMEVITELVAKLPDMEIDGVMSEKMEARVWELRMPDLPQEEQLAVELDRLSYDYDTVLYHDSTRNMTENVSELAESIKQGDTGHLTTWLADIISEGAVPEEIKRATELLEKLTEYKPLAKIEEAEEQNYNMIDNVLNNGVGEKAQREENKRMEEKPTVRISLKSRLAEKKSQVEGQSKEHDVQENEKKSQREM